MEYLVRYSPASMFQSVLDEWSAKGWRFMSAVKVDPLQFALFFERAILDAEDS